MHCLAKIIIEERRRHVISWPWCLIHIFFIFW